MLLCVAPAREFTAAEQAAVGQFVERGGVLVGMAGAVEGRKIRSILEPFGLGTSTAFRRPGAGRRRTARLPLSAVSGNGEFPLDRCLLCGVARSHPWAIRLHDRLHGRQKTGRRSGGEGKGFAVVIGDTCFGLNKTLENEDGEALVGERVNANFWRWFVGGLPGRQPWQPPAYDPSKAAPSEAANKADAERSEQHEEAATMRSWIAVALLSLSWMLGLEYYGAPNGWFWALAVIAAAACSPNCPADARAGPMRSLPRSWRRPVVWLGALALSADSPGARLGPVPFRAWGMRRDSSPRLGWARYGRGAILAAQAVACAATRCDRPLPRSALAGRNGVARRGSPASRRRPTGLSSPCSRLRGPRAASPPPGSWCSIRSLSGWPWGPCWWRSGRGKTMVRTRPAKRRRPGSPHACRGCLRHAENGLVRWLGSCSSCWHGAGPAGASDRMVPASGDARRPI